MLCPPIKETAEASSDDITSILPESNEISGWKTFTEDLSTTFKVCNENLLGNSLNDVAPSNLNANKETDYLFKDYGKLEEEKSVMSAQKASNPNTGVCSCPANLADIDFTGVCNPSLLMKADVTSSDASEHPCVAPFEETKGHPLKQNVEPSPSQNQDADSLGRCIADDIDSVLDHIHAKSSENKVTVQSIQPGRHPGMHVESSWPHKRQKVEDQLSNSPSLSLSMKGKCDWQENGGNENTPSTFMHEQFDVASISSLPQQNLENNEDHLEEGTRGVYPSSIMFSGDVNLEHFICDGRSKQKRKSQLGEDGEFATSLINSPCQPHAGLLSSDQSRPEVEGFITDSEHVCIGGDGISFPNLDLPKTTIECAGVLEQLCKSACIHTPLSQFPTTYGVHRTTDLYQSVPNGLLECMGQKSTLPNNDVLRSQLKVSTSCFDDATNNAFLGRSFSDCLLYSGSQVTEDGKKLHLSPMLWDKITSYSGSSEKRRSLNPDLPCISEENENTDEVVDRFQEDAAFEVVASSVKREPLADIKECPNVAAVVSGAEQFTFRDSLDSVNTAYSFTGTENGIKQKVEKHNASKRRDTSKLKKNRNMLPGANDTKRASESLRNRSSKLQLSDETSLRKGGPSFSQKEPKVNNIVSNITSFIPIVQQKQAASTITGKRDVKVKALEAAEAAKKLAEKKENDRKMKKEALKLERARLEQENLRQLELEKKKKEERKKKVADMAAKKRQREEEEKLEKERKRKHMEDARRQQRALEEKLRSKKDENEKESQAPDERGQTMKVPSDEAAKHKKVQKEIAGGNGGKVSEMELRTAVASTSVKPCTIIEDNTKVMSTLDRARESDNPIADIGQEQSYDISPYKGSDDEDDEPNNKFIPSWASKKRVALVVTSQQQLDPEGIFPPGSFCSISEVLLPRKLQQNRAS
ncbi:uncharacterized protein LOC120198537 isoform X1 [Hibiscus syriacus]|uniref:uncharacterized protein LOC120198537 isoform X1 n=1 Tax=Hibiscus syriacus TaxID=106335 RepID=UPI00192084B7|nr:uncharacterized protein LOC120198537 isoform X1 [Hibiscus syriacus]